jgi:ABC-type Na+ transport system ATPase subunit NatA
MGHTLAASFGFYSIATSLILYAIPMEVPKHNLLLPQMSFIRIYYYISKQCMETGCYQSFSQFSGELQSCLSYFIFTAVAYPAIAICINICWTYRLGNGLFSRSKLQVSVNSGYMMDASSSPSQNPSKVEGTPFVAGSCVKAEEQRVREDHLVKREEWPLICHGVSKTYSRAGSSFVALHPAYLAISKGEVLGLLGPNGAGKTTLISILTGLIQPDSGKAWIGGASIIDELPKVYKSIGVCPQFDLFWEDLTVEEHLLFYLRLKGSKHDFDSEIDEVLRVCTDVELQAHRYKLAKTLSGGMKRRLSLAIALIGNPDAIFLDEPTTGLDPLNREIFWGILQRIKKDKSIILTTHLMQEADFLSDRIGRFWSNSSNNPQRKTYVYRHTN